MSVKNTDTASLGSRLKLREIQMDFIHIKDVRFRYDVTSAPQFFDSILICDDMIDIKYITKEVDKQSLQVIIIVGKSNALKSAIGKKTLLMEVRSWEQAIECGYAMQDKKSEVLVCPANPNDFTYDDFIETINLL
jgi:hypothetical protein